MAPSHSNGALFIRGVTFILNVTLYIKNEALFRFLIKDEHGTPVFRIEGPCWTGSCCGSDVEFKVLYVGSDEQVFIFMIFNH